MKTALCFYLLLLHISVFAQFAETVTVLQYNLLGYTSGTYLGCNSTNNNIALKDGYLQTIIGYVQPDIFTVNEIRGTPQTSSETDHDRLIANSLYPASAVYAPAGTWARGSWLNSTSDPLISQIFYRSDKFSLISSTLIPCPGAIRDVHLFQLRYYKNDANGNPIDLWCVVMHTKAGSAPADEDDRALMTSQVMSYLSTNTVGPQNILIMGDFNLYTSTEVAYQNLLTHADTDIRFSDPINMPGNWSDNASFASIHTQSTRYDKDGDGFCYTGVDCGADCGSDDRFDFILATNCILNGTNKVSYQSGTYDVVGQDGNHLDKAIIDAPANVSASADVITALYENSDHYPVTLKLDFLVGFATSEASSPASQVGAGTISSLTDTPAEATAVFKFDIDDLGTAEGLVTKVTNIRIQPGVSNTADWTDHIQGVKLDNGATVTIGTPVITDSYIDIPITSGNLDINNNNSDEITFYIYLNTSNIIDNSVLSFMIDADNNGFESDPTGSVFNKVFTGGDVVSNNFTISVVATTLSFLQEPSAVAINTAMSPSVTVAGSDVNGNVDKNYAVNISITSNGTLTGTPVIVAPVNGLSTFSSLTHTVAELSKTLTATSGAYNATSSLFDIANCMITDNFEDGNLTGWGNTGNWVNSATSPIYGINSLKHNGSIDATDYINYVVSCGSSCGNISWQFNLKNGGWDPSSTTKFWFYLSANETDLTSVTIDGYAVGVDMSGATDMVTLWKVTNGSASSLIISTFDWNTSTTAGIRVTRNVYGQWTLYIDGDGGFNNLISYGSIINTDHAIANNLGLVFTTIASRAGQLWLDDFTWTCYPIVIAPEIDVQGNLLTISDGDVTPSVADWTDFGSTLTTTGSIDRVFTIYNTGTSDLAISGVPKVFVSGANAADFTITAQPSAASIVTGNNLTFTVHFDPSANGLRTATLTIANDDVNENPYDFSIQGTGIVPGVLTGDIAIVEYNCDAPDIFAFAALKDIPEGEVIKFTDKGWLGDNTGFITGEGIVTWTSPAGGISCGDVVHVDVSSLPISVSAGTATMSGTFSLTTTGDQIIAYQGTGPYSMLAAVHINAAAFATWDADATSTVTSALPLGLTNGTNCIALLQADNGKYNSSILIDTKANILSAIYNSANWIQDEALSQTFTDNFSVIECLGPIPEIEIQGNLIEIIDGDSSPATSDDTEFGSVDISGGSVIKTFTIFNTGAVNLNLTGTSPFVSISGTNATDFTVTVIPSTSIIASGSTSFQITFDPIAVGLRTATLTILNDDITEAIYNFDIQGTGTTTLPEINLTGNGISIIDGDITPSTLDHTDFGNVDLTAGTVTRTFTIENIGDATLTLTDASPYISISGAEAADFTLSVNPSSPIAASGNTTFSVEFNPSALGLRSATISISNDDANESIYDFTIYGNGTLVEPEIDILGNGVSIADGSTTPIVTDWTNFDVANITTGTVDRVFTIKNTGLDDLILSGVPKVVVSGTHASEFTVTVFPISPIALNGSTTFTVRFDPTAVGLRTAILTIANDDSDEGTYDFAIQGIGTNACATDLIISEYGDGGTLAESYIEIYNGTGAPVELSNYRLTVVNNGGVWDEGLYVLSAGTLADGATRILSTDATITNANEYFNTTVDFNGDDAIGLAKNTAGTWNLIDAIGQDGADPGTAWVVAGTGSTLNYTLTRKSSVFAGNTNWDSSRGTDANNSEWIAVSTPVLTAANAGHTMDCTVYTEPSNFPTNFSCGTTTMTTIPLTWTAAVTDLQAPQYYLIKWSSVSYAAISDPVDGTFTANGANAANVDYGTNSYTATGLTLNTAYYFKIWSYTNIGTDVNYKLLNEPQTDCSTLPNPCLTEDFASNALPADWIQTALTFATSNAAYNANNDEMTTLAIDNPMLLTFTINRSGTASDVEMNIQVSTTTQVGTFSTIATYNDANTTSGGTTNCTVDLSAYTNRTVYIKFIRTSTSTVIWYIDDIAVYCGNCVSPSTNSSNLTFSNINTTSLTFNIGTTGNGAKRIVVVRAGLPVSFTPINGSTYAANSVFSSATEVGPVGQGNKVLYNDFGNSTTITGLTANTSYYFKVFEYNCPVGSQNYYTGVTVLEGNQTTLPIACLLESSFAALPTDWIQSSVTFTAGNAQYQSMLGELTTLQIDYPTLLRFTLDQTDEAAVKDMLIEVSTTTQTGTFTTVATYNNTIGVAGVPVNCEVDLSTYTNTSVFIKFRKSSATTSYWKLDNVEAYCGNCVEPTVNPVDLSFSSVTNSSLNVNIGTVGNGVNRIIVARESGAVNFTPVDGTTYTANADYTAGTDLGAGNKIVYKGNGSTASISGLLGYKNYYFKVFEYNCALGAENYFTGGTILEGNITTVVSPVTNLKVVCKTNTSAEISWTNPIGDFDEVIIGIRNSTSPAHSITNNASGYTADATFGLGTQYGSTNPKSYVVYKGIGTSITITGLTVGQTFQVKAYAYKNASGSSWSASQPTTAISSLGISNPSGVFALTQNSQLQLQWTNPSAGCFDEIMIVGNQGSAIITVPSGDGSSYTGNLVFGSGTVYGSGRVVYKGTSSPVTVTGLTNGLEYCFTWFSRIGTDWSNGVSTCGTPNDITILYPGDLAIVAVNTAAQASGSADEICFFAFKDIKEGTSIEFTDNGYERLIADKWADSEGTIRITRDIGRGTVPKGNIICIQGAGNLDSDFEIYNCGTHETNKWTIESINNQGGIKGGYDLNVDDQIWIMQAGAWDNGGVLYDHNATYSGNILYGWTATGWKPASGYNSTAGSTLYPNSECFNSDVTVAANHSKVKYTGLTTTTSQAEWISRINNSANWTGYADNSLYEAGPDYIGTCTPFLSNLDFTPIDATWTGAADEDWFYCKNWGNLQIPDSSTNITITGAVPHDIIIDDGIPSIPEARCNNFTIVNNSTVSGSDLKLMVNNASSKLRIYGNFENNKIVEHSNGEIHYKGNFINNGTYTHNTAGIAFFDGGGAQTLTGATTFLNLQMNNTSTGLTLNNNIIVNNILTLTDGIISTGTNRIEIENDAIGSITGQSTNSYINGNLRRKVAAAGSYDFPIGTSANYEIANINLVTSTITYLDAKFTNPHSGTTMSGLSVNGTPLTAMLDYGFWTITPLAGTATNYDVTLTTRGHTNGGALATQHTIVKRDNAASSWAAFEANHSNSTQSGTGLNPITASLIGMSSFSDLGLAKSAEYPLPIGLLEFTGTLESRSVILRWSTASEINNDYFTLEKSRDGESFDKLGNVFGAGNSSKINEYSYFDESPYDGLSYYRLKQTDYDGRYFYSNIVCIFKNDENKLTITIDYSNYQSLSVFVNNPAMSSLNIRVTDMMGRIIYNEKINLKQNKIIVNISWNQLSQGIYNMILFNESETVTEKILIY